MKPKPSDLDPLLRHQLLKDLATAAPSRCPDENEVAAYLEGTLTASSRTGIEGHLAVCRRCQEELTLLLKTQKPADEAMFQPAPSREGWLYRLRLGMEWASVRRLQPALAVLALVAITGVFGYKLLQEPRFRPPILEQVQTAPVQDSVLEKEPRDSGPPASVPTENLRSSRPARGDRDEKAKDRQDLVLPSLQPAKGSIRPRAANLAGDAPENAGAVAGRKAELKETEETTATAPAAGARPTPAPPPQPELKPSVREKTGKEADTFAPALADKRFRAKPESTAPQAKIQPPEEEDRGLNSVDNLSVGEASKAKPIVSAAERQRLNLEKIRAMQKDSLPLKSLDSRLAGGQQLQAGGKLFELRNGLWTDPAIGENEVESAIAIQQSDRHYQERIRLLSKYQVLLDRPEDCLIKHEGKVYRIVKDVGRKGPQTK